jgi:hypothetical protein
LTRLAGLSSLRINPLLPALVAVSGAGLYLAGSHWVGAGVALGAGLALLNGLLLAKRVDVAAATGDVGTALMVMQLGLLVTFTVIGLATIVLIHFSLAMTVACAVGFVIAQLMILAAFYWTHGRSATGIETAGTSGRNAT